MRTEPVSAMAVIVPDSLDARARARWPRIRARRCSRAGPTSWSRSTTAAGSLEQVVAVGRVPELARRPGRRRRRSSIGAAATYARARARADRRRPRARARVRGAHRRLAADPQRGARSAATSPPLARGRHAAGAGRARRHGRARAAPAAADRCPIAELLHRPEALRARRGRARRRGARAGAPRPAGLSEGRRAQRDGHRGRVAGHRGRPRRAARRRRARFGRADAARARPTRAHGSRRGRAGATTVSTSTTRDAVEFGERVAAAAAPDRRSPLHRPTTVATRSSVHGAGARAPDGARA